MITRREGIDDLLAQRGGGAMLRKYYAVPRAAGEPDHGIMITTSALDLENDRVFPDGAELESYLANPVVLWLHDAFGHTASAGIPVGTSRSLEILPGRGIRATGIDWLEGDAFVDRVRNAWEQGKIRGASIGFLPLEGQPNQEGGYDIRKWRLLEWSLVPIPANPQAVRVLKNGREVELQAKGLKARLPAELLPVGHGAPGHRVDVTWGLNLRAARPTDDPLRWNRQLGPAFDVAREDLEPSRVQYDWAARYLGIPVKAVQELGDFVPSPRMGSFLSALEEQLGGWRVDDLRHITQEGKEAPPVHETIRLNSKAAKTFLIHGTRFMRRADDPKTKIVLDVQPDWGGLVVTCFVAHERAAVAIEFLSATWIRAKALNFLRGEAFALSGEFLERGAETWGDLFLEPKNAATVRRVVDLFNAKDAQLESRGMILLGPPGTGKTLSARIMLNHAQGTFLWVSARDFYRAGAFGGLMYAFELARECAPTVLLIEDVDNWITPWVVDLMKTEMDGLAQHRGIVTVVTTNAPEAFPEALIDRPGRFHDVLRFGLPSREQRRAMLLHWLPPEANAQDCDTAIAAATEQSEGWSGAHVRELVRFALVLQEQDGLSLAEALARAVEKVLEQRELIAERQAETGRYRPTQRAAEALWKRATPRPMLRIPGRHGETETPPPEPIEITADHMITDLLGVAWVLTGLSGPGPVIRVLRALLKQEQGTEVQSVICSKDRFDTQAEATAWVREHDFTVPEGGPDETETSWRYRQFDPDACQVGGLQNGETFSTIRLDEGVQAVVCQRGGRAADPEHKAEHDQCGEEMGKAGAAMQTAREHLEAAKAAHRAGGTMAAPPPESKAEPANVGTLRAMIADAFREIT